MIIHKLLQYGYFIENIKTNYLLVKILKEAPKKKIHFHDIFFKFSGDWNSAPLPV